MSKMKSNRGAKKRFKLSGPKRKLRVSSRRANRNHILTKNTAKIKRQRRGVTSLSKPDAKSAIRTMRGG